MGPGGKHAWGQGLLQVGTPCFPGRGGIGWGQEICAGQQSPLQLPDPFVRLLLEGFKGKKAKKSCDSLKRYQNKTLTQEDESVQTCDLLDF